MNQNQVPASPQSDFPHQSFLIIGWKWNEQGGPKAWEKFGANFVSQNIVSNSLTWSYSATASHIPL